PQLYAVRWEPDNGIFWFFFEDVGNSRLRDSRNFQRWIPAARWAARFHAATRNLSPSQTSFLPVWNLAHYSRLADRISGILAELDAKDRTIVAEALEHYASRISWFATLRKTVIHGQFFGKTLWCADEAAIGRSPSLIGRQRLWAPVALIWSAFRLGSGPKSKGFSCGALILRNTRLEPPSH